MGRDRNGDMKNKEGESNEVGCDSRGGLEARGGEEIREWLGNFCRRVWNGEGWPEKCKEGEIVPIVKKEEEKRVEEYKAITLMPTAYKVYATILVERLRKRIEENGLLPPN